MDPILIGTDLHNRKLVETAWDGTQEFLWFDADGNPVGLQHVAEHGSVLEANKQAQNDGTRGWSPTREMKKLATIPLGVIMDYCQEHGIPMQYATGGPEQMEIINRMLNDPDYALIRVE